LLRAKLFYSVASLPSATRADAIRHPATDRNQRRDDLAQFR